MNKTSRAAGVALLTVAAVLVTSCGGGGAGPSVGETRTYVSGGTLNVRSIGDFRSFDVQQTQDSTTNAIMANNYATLLYLGTDGKFEGFLAKSWKASSTSVSFTLKSGVTCADGTPLTATLVKNSFQRMFDIKTPYVPVLFGPGPYSMNADDASGTFTFTIGTPYSDLVYSFTQTFPNSLTGVICPAGLKDQTQLTTKMFGLGAYTLVEAVHRDHVTMKLRSDFAWGPYGVTAKSPGAADTVVFKIIDSDTTAANSIITGAVDVGLVAGPDVSRLLNESSLAHIDVLSSYMLQELAINESPGHIGTDETVRRALITAIDPKGWLQGSVNGRGQLSSSFVTTSVNCYDPAVTKLAPKPDIAAARKVLTDAGWTYADNKLTKNGQPLSFGFLGRAAHNSGPEYLVKQWTEMGAAVKLSVLDNTSFSQNLTAGNFDISIVAGVVPTPTIAPAAQRISGPVPPKGTNNSRTFDSVLDSEAAAAQQTTGAESCKHWANFQEQLWKRWHLLPLATPYDGFFTRNVDLSRAVSPGSRAPVAILARRYK
jgi:peptide/nickel transport system substrate-binding protein